MQIKLLCQCETKFAFEVEPVDGRMPFAIHCPTCNLDCTEYANAFIAQSLAPDPAPAPPPPTTGLRVKSSHHTPPPTPPPTPVSAPATASAAPGLNLHAHSKSAPEASGAPPAASSEPEVAEESFEARRTRRLAEAKSKQSSDLQEWGKAALIGKLAGAVVALLLGVYFWYYFSGSKPKPYYTAKLDGEGYGAKAKLTGKDELVVVDAKGVSLHDLKAGKVLWTVAGAPPAGEAADANEDEPPVDRKQVSDMNSDGSAKSFSQLISAFRRTDDLGLHVTEKDIWAVHNGQLLQLDRASGQEKKRTPVKGHFIDLSASEKHLLVVTAGGRDGESILRVDLATGESINETAPKDSKEETSAESREPIRKPPTAGNLMADELEMGRMRLSKQRSESIPVSDQLVKLDVKLLNANVVQQRVMSEAPTGPSKLNSKTRASSNPMAIAQETFNDIKRDSGSAYESIDQSTYEVAITRTRGGETTGETWTGTVTGNPSFHSSKTVDLVIAHQEVLLISRDNKLLGQTKLPYPSGESGGISFRRREQPPFAETADTLYFRDRGALTAFDLPSGTKRWDYTSVGISSILPDEKGAVYLCSTTASTDSIRHSEDINLADRPRAVVLKLDAKTGKLLWRSDQGAKDIFLSGKYLYATRPAGSTLALMAGEDTPSNTYFLRLNPRNGKTLWSHTHKGEAEEVDFFQNRILILGGGEVRVMKFLTL